MMVFNDTLTMSADEWADFQRITHALWKPRTPEEFNAMCDLGAARHKADNTDGTGWIHAMGCSEMKFGPQGEMRSFVSSRSHPRRVPDSSQWTDPIEIQLKKGYPDLAVFEGSQSLGFQ
jgi:hypothetical protein